VREMALELEAASKTWGQKEAQEGLMRKRWKKKREKKESEEIRKEVEG
jgi:hypothetical protein